MASTTTAAKAHVTSATMSGIATASSICAPESPALPTDGIRKNGL
jgi:hypothetical protein